jgi:hypothetical protein
MKLIIDRDDNYVPRWGMSLKCRKWGWYLILDLWKIWICLGVEK